MNGRLFLVYFTGILLLASSYGKTTRPPSRANKSLPFTLNRYEEIRSEFNSKKAAALLNAFVSGNKKRIPKKTKTTFEELGILHLFTPSGVHLSSILFLFLSLLSRVKHRLFFYIPLLALAYLCTPFHSIKRILLLKSVKAWKPSTHIFNCFLISFIWDFFLGTYKLSPLSFSYSFLFLGIIVSYIDKPKLTLPLAIFGGQIIANLFTGVPLFISGFFWNSVLTFVFGLLYPFFFIFFWFPSIPFSEEVLKVFIWATNFSHTMATLTGRIYPTLNLVILCFYLTGGGRRTFLISLLLLFSSTPLMNIKSKPRGAPHDQIPYEIIEYNRNGFTTWHSDRICRHRHTLTTFHIKCNLD